MHPDAFGNAAAALRAGPIELYFNFCRRRFIMRAEDNTYTRRNRQTATAHDTDRSLHKGPRKRPDNNWVINGGVWEHR